MKKFLSLFIIFALAFVTFSLTSCSDKNGTYYPGSGEMKENLENTGYTVTITTDPDERPGTCLSAYNNGEYIEFYWLTRADDCEYFYNLLKENHTDYNSLSQIENDEKFGNIVFCGTEKAVHAAGIKIIQVKVNLN